MWNCWFHWICISKTKQHKKCCHGIFICLSPHLSITIEERHKNVTSVSSMFSVTIFHILFTIQSQRISSNCILFRRAPKWTFFLLHQMYPTQMLLRLSSMDYQISLSLHLLTTFANYFCLFRSLPLFLFSPKRCQAYQMCLSLSCTKWYSPYPIKSHILSKQHCCSTTTFKFKKHAFPIKIKMYAVI